MVDILLFSAEHLEIKKFKRVVLLTRSHVEARFNFVRKDHVWSSQQWAYIVFSVEKIMESERT